MATINLLRLAVGITDMNHLAAVQKTRIFTYRGSKATEARTKRRPTREVELLNGGSLYWVIRNNILLRQYVMGFEVGEGEDGTHCRLILDPQLVRVAPAHKKAFQGWRYLEPSDAPRDMGVLYPGVMEDDSGSEAVADDLRALGLL